MYYVTMPELTGEESKKKSGKNRSKDKNKGKKSKIHSLPLNEQNMLNN